MPYVAVSIPQDFVQYVAELPAEDGAAVQREAQRVGPEGVGSLLPVSPQDDSCCSVVQEAQTGGVFRWSPVNKMKATLIGVQLHSISFSLRYAIVLHFRIMTAVVRPHIPIFKSNRKYVKQQNLLKNAVSWWLDMDADCAATEAKQWQTATVKIKTVTA